MIKAARLAMALLTLLCAVAAIVWIAALHTVEVISLVGCIVLALLVSNVFNLPRVSILGRRISATRLVTLCFLFATGLSLAAHSNGSDPTWSGAPEVLGFTTYESLEVPRLAEIRFEEGQSRLRVEETLRLTNENLLDLYEIPLDSPEDLDPRWRALVIEVIAEELDGWEMSLNTPRTLEMEREETIALEDFRLTTGAEIAITTFRDEDLFADEPFAKRLVADSTSNVTLFAPCHSLASSSPIPDSSSCFGQAAEWAWIADGNDLEVSATFVHPYLRSSIGNWWVNRTSGSIFSLLIGGPILFLIFEAAKYVVQRVFRRSEAAPSASVSVEPDLEIEVHDLSLSLHERALNTSASYKLKESGIYVPTAMRSSDNEG